MNEPRYYAIVRMNEDGDLDILDGYDTYEWADEVFDSYCQRYPHASLDILPVH